MAEHEVRTDLLTPNEQDILNRFSVEIKEQGINFERQLSEVESRWVGCILLDLFARSQDEDNNLNWALGDWAIQADDWFGNGMGEEWPVQYAEIKAMRDFLLRLTGGTLVALQAVEQTIQLCCVQLQLKGINLSIADVFTPSTAKGKTTLGLLKNALKDKGIFVADFEKRLDKFVNDRNRFAHYYFVEHSIHPAEGYEAIAASQLASLNFIKDLLLEANNLQNLFYGLWYSLGEAAAVREGKTDDLASSPFSDWEKYKQDFLNVKAG